MRASDLPTAREREGLRRLARQAVDTEAAEVSKMLDTVPPSRARSRRGKSSSLRWRCHSCGAEFTVMAEACRHTDDGHARLELVWPDRSAAS